MARELAEVWQLLSQCETDPIKAQRLRDEAFIFQMIADDDDLYLLEAAQDEEFLEQQAQHLQQVRFAPIYADLEDPRVTKSTNLPRSRSSWTRAMHGSLRML